MTRIEKIKHIREVTMSPENKPQQVKEKIVEGKLQRYYSERCLLNQQFVKNEEITVKQLVQSVSSVMGET